MTGITKRFPGVLANDRIDFTVAPGTVHALLGENGAGKTTLMNILSGRYAPDEGDIRVGDAPVRFRSPRDALRSGIGMVHQHFMLVPRQTAAENIALGLVRPRLLLRRRRMEAEVRQAAEASGLPIDPQARVADLSLGQQQRVEILKLLVRGTDLLILDEPTAVLTPAETEELFSTLRQFARAGRSVVFITHKLEEVLEVADRITILRRGRRVADLARSEVDNRRELARLMVGREVVLSVEKRPVPLGDVVLELRNCSGPDASGHRGFRRVSFAVRRGEIFSIVGVAGNGQTELAAAVTGASRISRGELRLLGRPLGPDESPPMDQIAYVPEDRIGTGTAAGLTLVDNLILTTYPRFFRRGFFRREAARAHARELLERFRVAVPGPDVSSAPAVGRQPPEGDSGARALEESPPDCRRAADARPGCSLDGGDLGGAAAPA